MKIGLLRNLLKTAKLLSVVEGKSEPSIDESDLQIEINPSIAEEATGDNTTDEIEDRS